jgi:hypothetical protein
LIEQLTNRTDTVNPIAIGALVLVCTFGGALAGMWLRGVLPTQHLDAESTGTVKVGIGLIATMTALVLGLVTGAAKSSFDQMSTAIRNTATDLLALDRTLARYGPEGAEARNLLYHAVQVRLDAIWPQSSSQTVKLDVPDVGSAETLVARIQGLAPQNDEQRWLRSRALSLGEDMLEARWIASSGGGTTVLGPFLVALLFWLGLTFASFGLFAPRNVTVIATLFLCALSVAGAVFLVLEMDGPFEGVVKVSPQPLRYALAQMNQ